MQHVCSLAKRPVLYRSNWGQCAVGRSVFTINDWWSLLLFDYDAAVSLDGRPYQLTAKTILLVPPGVEKVYQTERQAKHQYAHLRLKKSSTAALQLPECIVVDELERWRSDFQEIIDAWVCQRVLAAEVHLWHFLHRLGSQFGSLLHEQQVHPGAAKAMALLSEDLADAPSLSVLAKQVGLSQNHLNTLFKQDFGETVHACLLRMRLEYAHDLLMHSDRPISAIAASIGVADLQAFNKLIRRGFGVSPRALRQRQ